MNTLALVDPELRDALVAQTPLTAETSQETIRLAPAASAASRSAEMPGASGGRDPKLLPAPRNAQDAEELAVRAAEPAWDAARLAAPRARVVAFFAEARARPATRSPRPAA